MTRPHTHTFKPLFSRVLSFVLSLLVTAAASASPVVDNLAKTLAPKAKKAGDDLQGTQLDNDLFVTMTPGNCYWLIGAAESGAKVLHFWLFNPKGKRVAEMKNDTPQQQLVYCPDTPGSYKLLVKVRPQIPFTVGVFAEEGQPGDYAADGRVTKKAPPPPAANPANNILDPGPVTPGTNAALAVACDCGAMEIYLDGQLFNVQSGSYRIPDLGSGAHALKIMGWKHAFSRAKFFEGTINLHANTETRIQVNKGGATVMAKTPIAPPPPPPRVADNRTYADIDASIELVRDARELARDDRCGRRLDEKFQQLDDSIRWVRDNVSAQNLADVAQRTNDVVDYAQDACSPRIAGAVSKKLGRVKLKLDSAKRSVD